MLDYESPSKWTPVLVHQSIDPILLNDRRITISQEMHEAIRLDKGLARGEERKLKNSGYFPGAWADLEIRRADEWADKLVKAWLEIWEIQGRAKCHALFRAVFDWELIPLFATRKSCFQAESVQLETRTGQPGRFAAARGHFARQMGKLISKWNRKLDVADREAMYREVSGLQASLSIQRVNMPSAFYPPLNSVIPELTTEQVREVAFIHTWKQLAAIFRDIDRKAPGQIFSATFMPAEGDSNVFNREWILGGNPDCRLEFENFASIAARKFGYLQREGATDYWLDCVREWMQAKGLDKDKTMAFRANVPTGEALDILKIAEMSARFCTNLMVRGTAESAVPPLSKDSNTLPKATPTVPKTNSRSKSRLSYRSEIKRAIQTELTKFPTATDLAICRAIDSNGNAELSKNWQPEPGERSFEKAYMDSGKRPLIEKTISKVRVDMRAVHLLPLR